jgi:hypothetical protein
MLLSYFKAALEDNEFCVWVVSEPLSEREAWDGLREAMPDFDHYLSKRSIEELTQCRGPSNRQFPYCRQSLLGITSCFARRSDAMRAEWVQVNPYDVIMSACQRLMTLFSMHASKPSSLARLAMET